MRPARSPGGQRRYTEADLTRLTLLSAAVRAGHRIGTIAQMSNRRLKALASEAEPVQASPQKPAAPTSELLTACQEAVRGEDWPALLSLTGTHLEAKGIVSFVEDLLEPLIPRLPDASASPAELGRSTTAFGVLEGLLRLHLRRQPSKRAESVVLVAHLPTPAGRLRGLALSAVAAAEGVQPALVPFDEVETQLVAVRPSLVTWPGLAEDERAVIGPFLPRWAQAPQPNRPLFFETRLRSDRAVTPVPRAVPPALTTNAQGLRAVLARLPTGPSRPPKPRHRPTPSVEEAHLRAHQSRARADVPEELPSAGLLHAIELLSDHQDQLLQDLQRRHPHFGALALASLDERFSRARVEQTLDEFTERFPPPQQPEGRPEALSRMIGLRVAQANPALAEAHSWEEEGALESRTHYRELVDALGSPHELLPRGATQGIALLRVPQEQSPDSIEAQLEVAMELQTGTRRERERLARGLDLLREEHAPRFQGASAPPPPRTELDSLASAPAQFSADRGWMKRLSVVAKNVMVWMAQMAQDSGRAVRRLDEVPDAELQRLVDLGFTGLWLVGVWERSPASKQLKHRAGFTSAVGSAYAVRRYRIARRLGGRRALSDLHRRARAHGLRLACDIVPNHLAIDSDWVLKSPERFLSVPRCPFPNYTFTGEDLSPDPQVALYLEDGYYTQSDAAVVFQRIDRKTGEERYIYHGNDGTGLPWNDTAQLDFLRPETREAVIDSIVKIARQFPVLRLDAAMTLARQHVQRLWYPPPGQGGAIPSRSQFGLSDEEFVRRMPQEFWREVVDRLRKEAPATLLLAEAFWFLEGYFARNLGIHRVYNSAFMHMLRTRKNRELRNFLLEILNFDPRILGRFANFLTTPDEPTARSQFGTGDRYFGICTLLATLPGLPIFGHGQVEGFEEKYGMEFATAQLAEEPDTALIERHQHTIQPLLQRRILFAEADGFSVVHPEDSAGASLDDLLVFSHRRGRATALVVFNHSDQEVRAQLRRTARLASGETKPLHLALSSTDEKTIELTCHRTEERIVVSPSSGVGLALGPFESRVFWNGHAKRLGVRRRTSQNRQPREPRRRSRKKEGTRT